MKNYTIKSCLLVISILLFHASRAQTVKFTPISSKTASVLAKPTGLPYQGNYTSSTEVFEDEGKYYMLVNDLVGGWPSEKINIALLESTDLENWSWFDQPLLASEDMPYQLDKPHGFATSIVKKGRAYYLYMDVLDNDKNVGIGLATSSSLKGPWRVHKKLIMEKSKNQWDSVSLAGPDVIIKDNQFVMYYMGVLDKGPNGETAVGIAKSKDGIKWSKEKAPVLVKSNAGFDSYRVGVPKVIEDADGYTMIYRTDDGDGTYAGNSAYGIAKSKDGFKWNRIQSEHVLSENDVQNWMTIWACGFIKVEDTYHLFLEYDGPPSYDTRVNHAIYKKNK